MYWISSDVDVPNIKKMRERAEELMRLGVRVQDKNGRREKCQMEANAALAKIRSEYGIQNPNSSKQVVAFISENADDTVAGMCYDSRTEKWSSKADFIEPLADMGYEWAAELMRYRKYTKMVENINSLLSVADENGFVHPEVSILKSNRISYSKPALMSINKELLWDLVVPRTEGNQLWSVDIKNQEPWIMINMLDVGILKDIMIEANKKGTSLYREIYYEVYGKECTSTVEYAEMKRCWNMLTYGGSKMGLRVYAKHIDADALYDFFSNIPELSKYKSDTFRMAKANTQFVDTYFGTKVCADKLGPGLQRTLMDLPIQGTGADILALLIERLFEQTEEKQIDDFMSLYYTRHDELIVEVDSDWAKKVGEEHVEMELREILEHRIDGWEPFGVEVKRVV